MTAHRRETERGQPQSIALPSRLGNAAQMAAAAGHLPRLPEDAHRAIAEYLDTRALLALAGTSRTMRSHLAALLPACRVQKSARQARSLTAFDAALAQLAGIASARQTVRTASILFDAIGHLPASERRAACEHLAHVLPETSIGHGLVGPDRFLQALSSLHAEAGDAHFFQLLDDIGRLPAPAHASAIKRLYRAMCVLDTAVLPDFTRLSSLLRSVPDGNHCVSVEMLGRTIALYPPEFHHSAFRQLLDHVRELIPVDRHGAVLAALSRAIPLLPESLHDSAYQQLVALELTVDEASCRSLLDCLSVAGPGWPGCDPGQARLHLIGLLRGSIALETFWRMIRVVLANAAVMKDNTCRDVFAVLTPHVFRLRSPLREAGIREIFGSITSLSWFGAQFMLGFLGQEIRTLPHGGQQRMIALLAMTVSSNTRASSLQHGFLTELVTLLQGNGDELLARVLDSHWNVLDRSSELCTFLLELPFHAPLDHPCPRTAPLIREAFSRADDHGFPESFSGLLEWSTRFSPAQRRMALRELQNAIPRLPANLQDDYRLQLSGDLRRMPTQTQERGLGRLASPRERWQRQY